MFLHRPAHRDLARAQINHRDLGLGPEADVEPGTFLIENACVRKRVVWSCLIEPGFGALGDGRLVGRCPMARPSCSAAKPPLIDIGDGRAIACPIVIERTST